MAATTVKICALCGTDVSQRKRTKDQLGRYYCEACVAAANAAAAPNPAGRACANCGQPFGALEQGNEWNGHRVCARCITSLRVEGEAQREANERAAEQAAAQAEVAQQAETKRKAAISRAREARFNALLCIIFFSLVALAALVTQIKYSASVDPQFARAAGILWLIGMVLPGLVVSFNILTYIHLGTKLAGGNIEAMLRVPTSGLSSASVMPFAALISLAALVVPTWYVSGVGAAMY